MVYFVFKLNLNAVMIYIMNPRDAQTSIKLSNSCRTILKTCQVFRNILLSVVYFVFKLNLNAVMIYIMNPRDAQTSIKLSNSCRTILKTCQVFRNILLSVVYFNI